MKRGLSAMGIIVYTLIVIVVVFTAIYFIYGNIEGLKEGFFNILASFK